MELWGYINLHKLDLTISKYHIRYLTNSYKTMEYHQLWRPLAISAPLPIPGCGSPRVSLTDECSPTVPRFWFFFQGRWWTNWAFFGWFIPFYTHKNAIYDGFMMVYTHPIDGFWWSLDGFYCWVYHRKNIEHLLSRNRSPMFMTWLRLVKFKKHNRSIHPILLVG